MRTVLTWITATAIAACSCVASAADGALDSTFGTGGKVQIQFPLPPGATASYTWMDTAVQPDRKIVTVGYGTSTYQGTTYYGWVAARLNTDGSLDTSFGVAQGGYVAFYSGQHVENQAFAVALRPDGHIVIGGTILDDNTGLDTAVVVQINADGTSDSTFGNNGPGATYVTPASGDGNYLSRLVLGSDGTIDIAGFNHDHTRNVNRFLFDRISADGRTVEPMFTYEFGSGPNQDDHATDLAIDSQGRYVVGGYHRGSNGTYDCAVIRIQHSLYDVDPSFGSGGETTIAFNLGGDNVDQCTAVAVIPPSDYVVLGGHATAMTADGAYQAAILAFLDNNGQVAVNNGGGTGNLPDLFAFAYNNHPLAGTSNAINKLIIDYYDTQFPQLLAIGSGWISGMPYGDAFGIARLNLPFYPNFTLDTTFNGGGTQSVYFAECPGNRGFQQTHNYAQSAAFVNGQLVAVGDTAACSGGTVPTVARFAAFDGIFKNGFEQPSY